MQTAPIHPNDDMFTGSIEHYERCGKQLADFASIAGDMSGSARPLLLELPCGYGRVTRHLVKLFDATAISVADIMVPAVDFTVESFGVTGHIVSEPVNEFRNIPEGAFDVAVMGSLITHLSESNTRTVLAHFLSKLRPAGVAVITSHGAKAHEMLAANGWFEITGSDRATLMKAYANDQYGFVNYDANHSFEKKTVDYIGKSYGVSLIPDAWMRDTIAELGFAVKRHIPAGWDDHQDVYFISRA